MTILVVTNGFVIKFINPRKYFQEKVKSYIISVLIQKKMKSGYIQIKTGVVNLFCLVYPLPKEKSIIYPQCTATAFSVLKIKVFLVFNSKNLPPRGKFTPG